ncbi:unnamed protein product [Macrosiphum euphorbiae]|nr:unnamed protein product [Macrosiphum euphorbiae]
MGIPHKEPQKQYILSVLIGMSGDNSPAIVVHICNSTRVAASVKNTSPSKSLVVSNAIVSAICQLMERLETYGDLDLSTSLPSNSFR